MYVLTSELEPALHMYADVQTSDSCASGIARSTRPRGRDRTRYIDCLLRMAFWSLDDPANDSIPE